MPDGGYLQARSQHTVYSWRFSEKEAWEQYFHQHANRFEQTYKFLAEGCLWRQKFEGLESWLEWLG